MLTTDFCIRYIEWGVQHAHFWGFLLILIFMTIESSFIPFPSEVVMIPGGFLAYRHELFFSSPITDSLIVIFCGATGSLLGASINYFLSLKLGRPFLYKYGKYFFLSAPTIARSEEIFNRYGDITTFVCRLLPAIRQLISIPAGLAQMPLLRFIFFTFLGAGIWSAILVLTGYYFASISSDMSYTELVMNGKNAIRRNYPYLLLGLVVIIIVYIKVHRKIMASHTLKSK
ncbi:MAG: DedA family protein [Candidatus Scalindua sp.]|nr:DedA family protein [Candidatus Scalindua sp.]